MNVTSLQIDHNDGVSLRVKRPTKSGAENANFADFSSWNEASHRKQAATESGVEETPTTEKQKLKAGPTPNSGKLKKKKSIKKLSPKTDEASPLSRKEMSRSPSRKETRHSPSQKKDVGHSPAPKKEATPSPTRSKKTNIGKHEHFQDEPQESVNAAKPKKKKVVKKKTAKDNDAIEKAKQRAILKPRLDVLASRSQTKLEVEGSVSSMREELREESMHSDHDSSLTESVMLSDSSVLNDSDASSIFLNDPYEVDSSEEDASMLFLTMPDIKPKANKIDSVALKGAAQQHTTEETSYMPNSVTNNMAKTATAVAAASALATNAPDNVKPTSETTTVVSAAATAPAQIHIPGQIILESSSALESSITISQVFRATNKEPEDATAKQERTGITEESAVDSDLTRGVSSKSMSGRKRMERSWRYREMERNPFIAEADFQSFFPALCSCCSCCVNKAINKRAFAHVYANRLEVNYPVGVYGFCSREECIRDNVQVYFFDRPPFRTGMAPWPFCCCLCTSCGPPVMAATRPWLVCCTFECCDLTPCFGEIIFSSPCNCYDCKEYVCCGALCWWQYACPFIRGLKHADSFLSTLHEAVKDYRGSAILSPPMEIDEMVLMFSDKRQVASNIMERS